MRFKFTGNANAVTDADKKGYFDRSGKSKNGNPYTSITFSVASSPNNRGYVEVFGMERDTIKTFDNDGNKIEIDWEDRNDEGVLKTVRQKNVMNFTEDGRKEFIADLDVAEFIKDHIFELDKKKVVVTGQVNKDFYNGNARDRFVVQSIYTADDNAKTGLNIMGEYFFTKDSIDTADWKSEHKLYINGYTKEYVATEKKQMYVARQLVFDCSKLDFENDKHIALANFRLAQIGLKYEDGVIVNNLKAKKVYKTSAIISYTNGAEEIAFDEKELTENQRTAIELGFKTLDDFKPKGKIYGDRKIEYKLVDFDMRDEYADGCVVLNDTINEFEDEIYVPAMAESEDDAFMNKPEEKKPTKTKAKAEEEESDDDDDLDLFN